MILWKLWANVVRSRLLSTLNGIHVTDDVINRSIVRSNIVLKVFAAVQVILIAKVFYDSNVVEDYDYILFPINFALQMAEPFRFLLSNISGCFVILTYIFATGQLTFMKKQIKSTKSSLRAIKTAKKSTVTYRRLKMVCKQSVIFTFPVFIACLFHLTSISLSITAVMLEKLNRKIDYLFLQFPDRFVSLLLCFIAIVSTLHLRFKVSCQEFACLCHRGLCHRARELITRGV
ncbi:hypothetical protein CHUAL_008453 [Chamberlinius hualienensis]